MKRSVLFVLAGLLVCLAVGDLAAGQGFGRRYRNRGQASRYLKPVDDPTYKEQCGACHLAYQPDFLPAGSWSKVLAGLEEHGGTGVELEEGDRKSIGRYLEANCAERSRCRQADLILQSLNGRTPLKITEVPYIRDRHRESGLLPPGVFERKSVGSRANCVACHTRAAEGIYGYVRVPE